MRSHAAFRAGSPGQPGKCLAYGHLPLLRCGYAQADATLPGSSRSWHVLAQLHSADPPARARALHSICPCAAGFPPYERFRSEVKRLQRDPDPEVRTAELHVEHDARPGAFGPPVGVGVAVGAGQAHADALGFALGVSLHVILGIAVTDAGAFAYAVAVILGNPAPSPSPLAVAPGTVAAVGPD
jgi:hypothetical protein